MAHCLHACTALHNAYTVWWEEHVRVCGGGGGTVRGELPTKAAAAVMAGAARGAGRAWTQWQYIHCIYYIYHLDIHSI